MWTFVIIIINVSKLKYKGIRVSGLAKQTILDTLTLLKLILNKLHFVLIIWDIILLSKICSDEFFISKI